MSKTLPSYKSLPGCFKPVLNFYLNSSQKSIILVFRNFANLPLPSVGDAIWVCIS